MSARSIVLVGWPDSGKTNFLGAFWESVRTGAGSLVAPTPPDEIKYVEEALDFQSRGEFAPRSDKNLEQSRKDFTLPVKLIAVPAAEAAVVVVPDVTGELWKAAVETGELPPEWMDELRAASGALLFVRVQSPLNVDPLDWVTTERLLRMKTLEDADEAAARSIPTQVTLCELLRFLELSMPTAPGGEKPRVAVMLTAWDLVDAETAGRGPRAFLAAEYPLFSGRLDDVERLDVRVFGVSAVGGDFADPVFKAKYLDDGSVSGYVVTRQGGDQIADVGLPIAWVLGGHIADP
jgi:hypothetical protein